MTLTQITEKGIKDGEIVNADINASAAIARSKLANVDLVDDSSPQLGGALDTNNKNINFADGVEAVFGTGYDSAVKFNGADLVITTAGKIKAYGGSTGIELYSNDNSETLAKFIKDGACELYHGMGGSTAAEKKFETWSGGCQVHGSFHTDELVLQDNEKIKVGSATNGDLQIYHTGSESYISNNTGNLYIESKSGQTAIQIIPDGATDLRHSGSKKLETTSAGVTVTGSLGIGTTAPTNLLDVRADATSTKVHIGSSDGTLGNMPNSSEYGISLAGNNAEFQLHKDGSGNYQLVLGTYQGSVDIPLVFRTGSRQERMRIDSSTGRVGIGTDSMACALHVKHATNNELLRLESGDQYAHMVFKDSGSTYDIIVGADTDDLRFLVGGTEKMRLKSGGDLSLANGNIVFATTGTGLDFGATSDATGKTSELLDDYEEGTYTPKLRFSNNLSADDPVTFNSRDGIYTKIGRQVHVRAFFNISNLNGETGNLYITLPISAQNNHAGTLVGDGFEFGTSNYFAGGFGLTSGSLATIGYQRENVWSHVTHSQLGAGGMYFEITYFV